MINSVVLVGRLVNDPEMKTATSGTAIANFRLAVARPVKSGEGKEDTDFINIVAFGKTAELAGQYLDKGAVVGIEGRIQTRTWEKDGKKNYAVEVIANNLRFIESKAEAERRRATKGQAAPAGGAAPGQGRPPAPAPDEADEDDDPFA